MKTLQEAYTEAEYIRSVNPINPGDSFNNDPECFATYCDMQANSMLALGMVKWAHVKDVRDARDIARGSRIQILKV